MRLGCVGSDESSAYLPVARIQQVPAAISISQPKNRAAAAAVRSGFDFERAQLNLINLSHTSGKEEVFPIRRHERRILEEFLIYRRSQILWRCPRAILIEADVKIPFSISAGPVRSKDEIAFVRGNERIRGFSIIESMSVK